MNYKEEAEHHNNRKDESPTTSEKPNLYAEKLLPFRIVSVDSDLRSKASKDKKKWEQTVCGNMSLGWWFLVAFCSFTSPGITLAESTRAVINPIRANFKSQPIQSKEMMPELMNIHLGEGRTDVLHRCVLQETLNLLYKEVPQELRSCLLKVTTPQWHNAKTTMISISRPLKLLSTHQMR